MIYIYTQAFEWQVTRYILLCSYLSIQRFEHRRLVREGKERKKKKEKRKNDKETKKKKQRRQNTHAPAHVT